MAIFASASFTHINRSVTTGPDYTGKASWTVEINTFEWKWRFFSDVGEPFNAAIDIAAIGHGPGNRLRFGVIDSGGNAAIWTIGGNLLNPLNWSIGAVLKGPWTFEGDPTVYGPFLLLRVAPVHYQQEPLGKV